MKEQVAVVPGSAYGNSCSRFVRVGIGAESEERIKEALLILRDLIVYSGDKISYTKKNCVTQKLNIKNKGIEYGCNCRVRVT